jgi:hypothetical protein
MSNAIASWFGRNFSIGNAISISGWIIVFAVFGANLDKRLTIAEERLETQRTSYLKHLSDNADTDARQWQSIKEISTRQMEIARTLEGLRVTVDERTHRP